MLNRHFRRHTLLGLVLAVLGGGVWWFGQREPGEVNPPGRIEVSSSPARHSPAVPQAVTSPPPPSPAPSAPAPALFSFVSTPEAARPDGALPAPAQSVHYVRVDRTLVSGKQSPFWRAGGGRVAVPLPGGGSLTIAIEHSEMLGPDRFVSVGRVENRPGSQALFAWNEGFLHASIQQPAHGAMVLRAATEELSQFYEVDPARVPACGGPRQPAPAPASSPRSAAPGRSARLESGASLSPPVAAAETPQRAEVHVMMLYTPAVLGTMTGAARAAAVQSAFDLAIARVNRTFEASLITARVKLVRVAETNYDETASRPSQVQDDALTALYLENDGRMDEIHALRDAAGADIVCLALNRADAASSGLSFLLNAPDDPTNPQFAFSVVQYSNVAGTNVVPHEFGHLFGCAHDRENAMSGPGAFSFSYGYRFIGADGRRYHDIMAYPPGLELDYFSNPDVVLPPPVGVPIGIPAGLPGESNNALTIERTAFTTAGYRLQTQAAVSPGSLINVATRAFVGTGDNVMIGGFVVEGTRPKRMLIRAAGPALRDFGVSDALADPVLHIFNAGALAAENDNWSQIDGGEIAVAAARAGAFAFQPGSADAAVLVSLPPGAYSAVVEGANGGTGHGLVEAYEVEPDAARIINLATRAFAGRDGRELVGGFVVSGAEGATKRILIRVLGPTLGRPPFNMSGVLDDPEMELRNAAGDLLLRNDDWSTGAVGGASEENDFRPLVQTYGERRIFATGLAPANRREPCVLVDLPPGSYTVTVRPFELRSSNPLLDQPAAPGVGIIEVYEIRQ